MKPTIGIIGNKGRMGKAFTKLFRKRGMKVIGSDLHTKLTNQEVVRKADIVIFSVPISVTPSLIEVLAPQMKPRSLIMDLTSIKTPAVNAMKKSVPKSVEILGMHPMFNDTAVSDMRSQMMIICPIRKGPLTTWIIHFLKNEGAILEITSPKKHDRMMSVIQGITHLSAIATAMALKKLGVSVQESFRFSSPIYRLRLEMVGRILHQSPKLYAEIALKNPLTKASLEAYQESITILSDHITTYDFKGFVKDFEKAADHLGSFTSSAYRQTNKIISFISSSSSLS